LGCDRAGGALRAADGGLAGGADIRTSPFRRPARSRESWLSVPGSTLGRPTLGRLTVPRDGCDGAGRVDGSPGAGRAGETGFHCPRSFVSQPPEGRGRYTLPSGPA
jgi:hypothetical protein